MRPLGHFFVQQLVSLSWLVLNPPPLALAPGPAASQICVWLRNQVIALLTEELVFRACMLPMLALHGLGPAVFTCPLFFELESLSCLVLLRWSWQGTKNGEMGARGGPVQQAGRSVTCFLIFLSAHFHHIFEQLLLSHQSSVGSIFLSAGES